MARFLSYSTIVERALPRRSDVQWLAGRIATLPAFVDGCAVVCGSVSWGSHLWRSDIDVAHFSTVAHPRLEGSIREVIDDFHVRTGHALTAPQVDIVVIGAEAPGRVKPRNGLSAGALSAGRLPQEQPSLRTFDDVAIRFADHIGCIAQLKAEPWRSFFDRYLSSVQRDAAGRRDDIRAYVTAVTETWARQPLHALERGADGSFAERQLDLLGHAENYPSNLMRRILGELGRYPRPDRVSDIRAAFGQLPEPWARKLVVASAPFQSLTEQYESLVAGCKRAEQRIAATDYYSRLEALAAELPFAALQEAVWEYLGARP